MIDNFGRTITIEEIDGQQFYVAGGIRIVAESEAAVLSTFNAMAPEGWIFPQPQEDE
jgi:hypothetical protein